jgi:hypothetical protein
MPENRARTGFRGPSPSVGEATQFRKGVSGNPGGRPKTAALSEACREVLAKRVPDDPEGRTYAQAIAQVLADLALEGDILAARELTDRAEGKARQSIELEQQSHVAGEVVVTMMGAPLDFFRERAKSLGYKTIDQLPEARPGKTSPVKE